jgi:hypothetical protein
MREHGVTGWGADGLAEAFRNHERRGDFPAPGQRQEGHRQHIDDVADQRERPVASGPVAEVACHQPEHIADQLAEARDKTDDRSTGAQYREVWPGNAPGAFVGHIGEQTYNPQQDHEGHHCATRQASAPVICV